MYIVFRLVGLLRKYKKNNQERSKLIVIQLKIEISSKAEV